jgi:RTX calcium-binding nonapeptide repeat (4 copies)
MRGLAVVAACAAVLAGGSVAQASQGADVTRQDLVTESVIVYTADPGEANRMTIAPRAEGGFHISDPGASIRWLSVPPLSRCTASGSDAFCGLGRSTIHVELADGHDGYTSNAWDAPAFVSLGPGDDTASGGPERESFDGGPGADEIKGGLPGLEGLGGLPAEEITYASKLGPVTVTNDGAANDGTAGEGDNIMGVEQAVGSAFGDTISGFASAVGGAGNDELLAGAGGAIADGGPGNDVITGGDWRDELSGGDGNDTIHARDGEWDLIRCGTGLDVVHADAQDAFPPDAGCEDVRVG